MKLNLKKRKRILKRAILTGVLFVLVFFFYSLFRFLAFRLFRYDLFSHEIAVLLLSVFLASLVYKPIDHAILLLFRDVFFKSNVRDHSVLVQLARPLTGVLDRAELARSE